MGKKRFQVNFVTDSMMLSDDYRDFRYNRAHYRKRPVFKSHRYVAGYFAVFSLFAYFL